MTNLSIMSGTNKLMQYDVFLPLSKREVEVHVLSFDIVTVNEIEYVLIAEKLSKFTDFKLDKFTKESSQNYGYGYLFRLFSTKIWSNIELKQLFMADTHDIFCKKIQEYEAEIQKLHENNRMISFSKFDFINT